MYSHALVVIALSDDPSALNLRSSFHSEWAWKYCSKMKTDLRYTPTSAFRTYPRVKISVSIAEPIISTIDRLRSTVCTMLDSGLTSVYNAFHDAGSEVESIQDVRNIHVQMDTAVRDAYGWSDIDLGHDFHEIEYLPENDNVRFTICADARTEVLKRLLLLNHERAEQQ